MLYKLTECGLKLFAGLFGLFTAIKPCPIGRLFFGSLGLVLVFISAMCLLYFYCFTWALVAFYWCFAALLPLLFVYLA